MTNREKINKKNLQQAVDMDRLIGYVKRRYISITDSSQSKNIMEFKEDMLHSIELDSRYMTNPDLWYAIMRDFKQVFIEDGLAAKRLELLDVKLIDLYMHIFGYYMNPENR